MSEAAPGYRVGPHTYGFDHDRVRTQHHWPDAQADAVHYTSRGNRRYNDTLGKALMDERLLGP